VNTRPRLIAALLLALTFGIGSLTGMALEEALGIDWFEFLDEDNDEADDRLLVDLNLTREQRARAEDILEREEDRLEDYWESRLPEIQNILRATYAEIRALLSPEQQKLFDQRVSNLNGRVPTEVRQ
jgi:Spy/CpxP family protein refolding chaperone